MKKIIALVIAIMLLLCITSISMADTDKEIVFNGIPWGISILEVNNKLVELGYSSESPDETSLHTWPYHWQSDYSHTVKDTGLILSTCYWDDDSHKIAGYIVDWTTMLAYYDFDDTSVNRDAESSHFCQAIIEFRIDYELVDRAYDDLKAKLTKLYGQPKKVIVDDEAKGYEWYGLNNTVVRLEQHNGKDYKYIYLMYGIHNIDGILKDLRAMIVKTAPPADADDLSGL